MELPHVPLNHLADFTGFPALAASMPDTDGVIGPDELELVTAAICSFIEQCQPCQDRTTTDIADSPSATALLHVFAMEAASSIAAPVPITLREAMLHQLLDLSPRDRLRAVRSGVGMVASAMQIRRAAS